MSLQTQLTSAFTRIGTEFKSVRSAIGALTGLATSDKSTIVAAINEVNAKTASAGAAIDDTTPRTTTVYSSNKTQSVASAAASSLISDASATGSTTTTYSASKINAVANAAAAQAKADLINGAPGTLDTLGELASQMAADESAAAALTTAVSNRVRFDADQTYTTGQAAQLVSNLAAAGIAKQADLAALSTAVGDTTHDFSGDFTAALV